MNRATKAAMTAALPFMTLPLTLAGPLPTAAGAASTSAAADLIPSGPRTVLHTGPTPWSVPGDLGGVLCADTLACQEVYYQAIQSYGPIELGLAENVRVLDFAINDTSGDKVVYGFSGGARVVSKWLEQQAESDEEPAGDTNIVLLGNGGRKYGGLNGLFWGDLFNILMTPTDTDYEVLDVAREYDPLADFPDDPFNLLALANAWAGFNPVHLNYSAAELDTPGSYVWKEGNTTYVFIRTERLPILQGLYDLGLDELAEQFEGPLREVIDRAYNRDYLENATVIPESDSEEESTSSIQAAASANPADIDVSCSGYNTDGCDIWAEQSYNSVTPPNLEDATGWQNVLPNLFNAVASIPRAYLDALNDLSHALEVTGSWWVYTPTNVLGYDPADPPKITAVTNLAIPFQALSYPLAEFMSWWAKANFPMNAGCTATAPPTCQDAGAILAGMFGVPLSDLTTGYQFPELNNPVTDAEGAVGEEIPGEEGAPVPWSGVSVQLNPADPVYSVLNYLFAPPEQNVPAAITLDEVVQSLVRFSAAVWEDFNPFVPGSFLWKGEPYTKLTPYFLPYVEFLCPSCDPEHPEDPTPGVDDEDSPSVQAAGSTADSPTASANAVEQVSNSAVVEGPSEDGAGESPATDEEAVVLETTEADADAASLADAADESTDEAADTGDTGDTGADDPEVTDLADSTEEDSTAESIDADDADDSAESTSQDTSDESGTGGATSSAGSDGGSDD